MQTIDALDGNPATACTSCEQYAEFMKCLVERLDDKAATFEVHVVAATGPSVLLVCTFAGFSQCAFSIMIVEGKVADVVKVWNDGHAALNISSAGTAVAIKRSSNQPVTDRGRDWRGNMSSIQQNALNTHTPSMQNIQQNVAECAPFRDAAPKQAKSRPVCKKEEAMPVAIAFLQSVVNGVGWAECESLCVPGATFSIQATAALPGVSECNSCQQYAEWMKQFVESLENGKATLEVKVAAFDLIESTVALFCTIAVVSQCAFAIRITGGKVADVIMVWNDGYAAQHTSHSL